MRALPLALLLLVGCKKDDPAPSSDPAPAKEPAAAPAKATEPPPPPKPAVIDPATFVPVDLSSVTAIADIDAKGPPNATLTPDRVGFNETEPKGAVIEADGFALHIWRTTIGAERTVLPMEAQMTEAVYTETKAEPGTLEYTLATGGTTTYGFIVSIDGTRKGDLASGDSVHCGPAKTLSTPEALAPYRAACAAVAPKKK